ncbi:MAG: 3-phosphoserine/phosphohydroxythreonine transaminase [Planctomycetia bacterium]|nr:3-phosphoserine/phosphohydroxythreonine transaminase [Planctomycetia bacterium]
MTERVFNFSPGPAMLPEAVLREAQRDLLALPSYGMSILEVSHRGKAFTEILAATEANLRKLLDVPAGYQVLFLQGGSRLQFSMVPMNLLGDLAGPQRTADYVLTGSWGKYAVAEAKREGTVNIAYDATATNYDRLPQPGEVKLNPAAAYVHYTSNETIQGVQFPDDPQFGPAPLVCDASSDFLWRPIDISRYGLLYACAQKNAGPAGVTVVIVRDELLTRSPDRLPGMLNYRNFATEKSLYNTPPVFGIYIVKLVTDWLLGTIGGLAKMQELNRAKAGLLYDVLDRSNGFYRGHAQPASRSMMNVTFRLPSDELQEKFLAGAKALKLVELKGHRSVGGIRASIYNAMPREGVETLARFMEEFAKRS